MVEDSGKDESEPKEVFETIITTPGGLESPGTDGRSTEVQVAGFPSGVAIRLDTGKQHMLAMLTPEQVEDLRGELAKALTETDPDAVLKRQEYIDLFEMADRLD